MKNTFKLIPATLALLFGGVVLAQPTMEQPTTAQPTAACIIEKGRFDSDFYITFKGQGEGEKSILFSIPVKIEEFLSK